MAAQFLACLLYTSMSEIRALKETAWINPGRVPFDEAARECVLSIDDVRDAEARLARFADYFEHEFPETAASHGIIESPVRPIPAMQRLLENECGGSVPVSYTHLLRVHRSRLRLLPGQQSRADPRTGSHQERLTRFI